MKNYSQNNTYQTSKEYYLNVLKKEKINLNSSKEQLNIFDQQLEKFLEITYRFFNPFFVADDVPKTYKNEYSNRDIDKEFDEKIQRQIPSWLKVVIDFFIKIFHFFFPIKIIIYQLQQLKKCNYLKVLNQLSFQKLIINFFRANSSP